jgi:UDP-N-acetylglucosamine:LPS N-acetylglucosamine transferase
VRVELLTMNGGNGTLSASHALAEALSRRGASCHVTDLMREASGIGNILASIYNVLLSTDLGLASAYMGLAHAVPIDRVRAFNELTKGRVADLLVRARPDLVVNVCPWIPRLVMSACAMLHGSRPRVATVVVDLDEGAVGSWLDERVDLTVLPTQECADHLLGGRRSDARVEVLGMPVHREFYTGVPTRSEAKRRMGLGRRVVTVLGGREGGMFNLRLVRILRESDLDCELVIHCGMNERLRQEASRTGGVTVVGFLPSMRDLMLASDVIVTKPGALTVAELLTLRTDFIVNAVPSVMPQERGNVAFLERRGLARVCRDLDTFPELVRVCMAGGPSSTMVDIAATESIADMLLGLVEA